ncbi:MAG: TAXI family TRAP transporter solute-binding subunit [Xanthobacteraceae bacterium]
MGLGSLAGLRIGTAERDSTFLSQGHALKAVLERNPALTPIAVSISAHASVENAGRLDADDIDFGFMASNWIGRAKNGEAPFAKKIDLRMVAPMNAGPLFFITRADSGLRTVADVRGRRLVVGLQESGMAQHARVILGALGLTFADFLPVYLDFAAGADALARGEVDAQLQCPIPNKVMTALAERILLRVLAYASGDLETVLRAVPSYRRTMMRKNAIRGLDADVPQVAVVNVLVTHARVAETTVRDVASAIFAAREELPRLNALFTGLGALFEPLRSDGARALEFGGVALHAGALAAYRGCGLLR